MVEERVRTITTATNEAVDTDQEFTISEIEDVLDRLKYTAPGEDTVCYSTRHLFLRLINQSFSEGRLPTRWKKAKERQNASSHLTTSGFFESHGTICASQS